MWAHSLPRPSYLRSWCQCDGRLVQADEGERAVAKVVAIADGDTITVLLVRTQHKVRLEHIDAPESGQDVSTARDKCKRILGEAFVGDCNVNLEQVKLGYAWHYLQYSRYVAYAKAEKEATRSTCPSRTWSPNKQPASQLEQTTYFSVVGRFGDKVDLPCLWFLCFQ